MIEIDKLLDDIELENNYSTALTELEKEKILNIILKKSKLEKQKKKKHTPRSIFIIAACMTVILAVSTVFAVQLLQPDKSLSSHLNISEKQQGELSSAIHEPLCSVSKNGVTVSVLQTLSDSRTLYAVVEAVFPENTNLTDDYFFEQASFAPVDWERFAPFSVNFTTTSQEKNKRIYIASVQGASTDFSDCELSLTFKNLLKKCWAEDGSLLKDENANPISETIINGEWELKWKYDSNIKTNIKILEPNAKFTAHSDYALSEHEYVTATVKKLTLSPLSLSIQSTLSEGAQCAEDNLFSAEAILDFKNGASVNLVSGDSPQISADEEFGYMYYRFENFVDISQIECIRIGDAVIYIN